MYTQPCLQAGNLIFYDARKHGMGPGNETTHNSGAYNLNICCIQAANLLVLKSK